MGNRLIFQNRLASTLIQKIERLKPSEIDPMTRRPLKPVDDVYFMEDTEALPAKDALRVLMHDFALYKCLK